MTEHTNRKSRVVSDPADVGPPVHGRRLGERTVVDFGLRRMHGAGAGLKAARAFHVAGIDATSNVLAGKVYGVPITGTMAHSYVQAHDDEIDAFRAFVREFPETVLLVELQRYTEQVTREVARTAADDGEAAVDAEDRETRPEGATNHG